MKSSMLNTNTINGIRTVSNWVATLVCVASLAMSTPAWASNPWGRAVGEAQVLHNVTEDLRNRASRLFPNSPATRLACVLDESACGILDLVKCGADWGQLQTALHSFEHINTHLCRAVAADCHMSRDRTIANYLRIIDDRFGDLVRDLSKCKRPIPICPSPYDSYYPPQWPVPYPECEHKPHIPQPVPSHRSIERLNPQIVNPYQPPAIPPQWQGSMPNRSSYQRSTYDFEATKPNHEPQFHTQDGNLAPVDRRSVGREQVERPLATEILGLLMSRATR
jgi:hypothetical protein